MQNRSFSVIPAAESEPGMRKSASQSSLSGSLGRPSNSASRDTLVLRETVLKNNSSGSLCMSQGTTPGASPQRRVGSPTQQDTTTGITVPPVRETPTVSDKGDFPAASFDSPPAGGGPAAGTADDQQEMTSPPSNQSVTISFVIAGVDYGTMAKPSAPGGSEDPNCETIMAEVPITYPASCRPDIGYCEMLTHLLWIAVPTLMANIFLFAAQTITMAFVGQRLGFHALAAFSVGISAFNICGASLGQGLSNALDTLASQAFGRDHNTPELGELLQRAMLVNFCVWIPVSILFYNSEPLLQMIYGAELGAHAYVFLKAAPLYLIGFYCTVSQTKIMQMQQRAYLPLMGHCLATLCCFAINHLFMVEGDQVDRAAWILCGCQFIVSTFLALCNIFHPGVITRNAQWPISPELWSKEKLVIYLKVGGSALTATCAEWWAFELLQVVAAQVGTTEVGAYTMMLNILMLYFSVSFGIGTGVATTVGNALGANQPQVALRYFKLVCGISVLTTMCTAGSLYFFGTQIMTLFTSETHVLETIDNVMHFFALYHALAATQGTLQGVFRGAGKQTNAARAAVFSLWIVGLPLAATFCLKFHMGLFGIFLGMVVGISVLIPLFLVQILRWNWEELAQLASTIHFVAAPSEGTSPMGNDNRKGFTGKEGSAAPSETTRLVSASTQKK